MGWLSFTSITCVLFLGYLGFTAKSFYEMFNPPKCEFKSRNKQCIYSIPNWQDDYTVKLSFKKYLKSLVL